MGISSKRKQVLALAKSKGLLRPRDLTTIGVDPAYLRRLEERGDLVKMGRGVYGLPDLELTENHTLAEVATCCPAATICLLSAARFHDLGSDSPGSVWVALERGRKRPTSAALPSLEVVWLTKDSRVTLEDSGIETRDIEGVSVKITSPARTVVDLFRFRNRVGLETALDALRDAIRQGVPVSDILCHANRLRVQKRILPYLQALV